MAVWLSVSKPILTSQQPLSAIRSSIASSLATFSVIWLSQRTLSGTKARNSSRALPGLAVNVASGNQRFLQPTSSISRTTCATGRVRNEPSVERIEQKSQLKVQPREKLIT